MFIEKSDRSCDVAPHLREFTIDVLTARKEPDAAREMIKFMISSEAAPLLRKAYPEPANP